MINELKMSVCTKKDISFKYTFLWYHIWNGKKYRSNQKRILTFDDRWNQGTVNPQNENYGNESIEETWTGIISIKNVFNLCKLYNARMGIAFLAYCNDNPIHVHFFWNKPFQEYCQENLLQSFCCFTNLFLWKHSKGVCSPYYYCSKFVMQRI